MGRSVTDCHTKGLDNPEPFLYNVTAGGCMCRRQHANKELGIAGLNGYLSGKVRSGMKTIKIRLTMMMDDVKKFVAIVNRYPYDIDLKSGRYVVDAKSLLGIFSIDLSKPITMTVYNDNCDDLLEDIGPYIIRED